MLRISDLFIYPVKSLGGISLSSAVVEERGFRYDRRWMLIDNENRFISQREIPALALFQIEITSDGLQILHKQIKSSIIIPFKPQTNDPVTVNIWDDSCNAQVVGTEVNQWFSDLLSFSCQLVFMPEFSRRKVDTNYASHEEITSFADGYPFLMIGRSSIDNLNARLDSPVEMNRFRPNIVFTGGQPFEEDALAEFTVNDIDFFGVKLCSRCMITTIDQVNALKGKEPLKTLSTYREMNGNVYFGQNLLHRGEGLIKIGDAIEVRKRKQPDFKS
jgi:uncharacterized protein YcbX